MPGAGVQLGAVVLCAHGGRAQPTETSPRVRFSGGAAVNTGAPWTVLGCPFPPVSGGPCASASWSAGSVRVTSMGRPLVIQGGFATCVPTAVPLIVATAQPRVRLT
ncbi:hypothetical protein [Streptomyces sp. NBC_01244]|uniref:hypothetical protein n=1 Tax=Streptomyces sp. NBC_01244 TaxID=2903797 RepID=UPI002E10FAC7|nr:hypothetical protein OG247_36405 [Streptomyces sp. NBC_01244]